MNYEANAATLMLFSKEDKILIRKSAQNKM